MARCSGIGWFVVCAGALGLAVGCEEGPPPAGTAAALGPGGHERGPGGSDPDRPGPGMEREPPPPFEPAAAVMPRLTATQYRNTLDDLFGEGLPRTPVEADTNPYLFYSIGATQTEVSARGVEQYAEAAFIVAEAVFASIERRNRVLGCIPRALGSECLEAFVRETGRRIFRAPLTEAEVELWIAVARETGDGDLVLGAETVLAGMLQSPRFLYRLEVGEPAPGGGHRYTSWEMAGRLAFLLTNAAPDETLLDAAADGELLDDASLEAHAQRLLDGPRARAAVQDFFAQYLDLERLSDVERDAERYPGYTPRLVRAMETELRLLVDEAVFRRGGDVRRLFSARRGYVNSDLAALYGVEAPGATATAFVPVEFPAEVPRAGVLTLGAFLTMNAHPTETSPTLRGKYVRERVLCMEVPPPPGDIDLNLERDQTDARTLRERLEEHRENPACAACHAFIDPPGFLFEHYDSVGRYRDSVDGYEVDSSGDLDGAPLADALDLAGVLADDERLGWCLTRQLYRYANGRLNERGEEAALRDLEQVFAEAGYDFRALLVALVLSEGFRTLAAPEEER